MTDTLYLRNQTVCLLLCCALIIVIPQNYPFCLSHLCVFPARHRLTSPYSYGYDPLKHNGSHIPYAKICFGSDQTQHMFIYPALTWLYPVCHFAWQSLQAIHHGTRLHDLWQRLFLIHKSQKDPFKIHEQSVLLQPVISVTVGQWRHGATERKVLPPFILQEDTQTQMYSNMRTYTCTQEQKVRSRF